MIEKQKNMNKISIICALSQNHGIGINNTLPWNIPEDLSFFKKKTLNHPIIMGRKTFESIGKALPKRDNIIITRNTSYTAEKCHIVHTIEDAIKYAQGLNTNEIFIIGGAQIYKEAMKYATHLYLTIVHQTFQADTFFPDYSKFTEIQRTTQNNGQYTFDFTEFSKF